MHVLAVTVKVAVLVANKLVIGVVVVLRLEIAFTVYQIHFRRLSFEVRGRKFIPTLNLEIC